MAFASDKYLQLHPELIPSPKLTGTVLAVLLLILMAWRESAAPKDDDLLQLCQIAKMDTKYQVKGRYTTSYRIIKPILQR